eukprot:TRINITY_DN19469_c0_g1_i1.p1 TRINITY_DN19469_c0_g1~~TRINITY_DN19469_c0_g1_i1.p1  ORF type:complete len:110 (+),score=6.15 TRINITY_DN19469_c0_g1_i1:61-390(+)
MTSAQDKFKFKDICRALSECAKKLKSHRPAAILREVFDKWREESGSDPETDNAFPIMRLLLPSLDHKRGSYGLKEAKIADLYIRALKLSKTSQDANRLRNFKSDPNVCL